MAMASISSKPGARNRKDLLIVMTNIVIFVETFEAMKKFLWFFCGAVLAVCGCTRRGEMHRMSGVVWHTEYNITYGGERNLDDSILEVMRRVELSLSPFDSCSVVSGINRGEGRLVDELFCRVLEGSMLVNRWSGGMFDPTVSPLVNLWGFGFKGNGGMEPSQAEIDSALRRVGIGVCRVADGELVVDTSEPREFNFSAITKGMGCDLIGEMLQRNGVDDWMVEIGGEVAVHGRNGRGQLWRIQVDAPVEGLAPGQKGLTALELEDCGVATSGNYRNFKVDSLGRRTWHTISPLTGRPAVSSTLSATVVAPNCMLADALATACMAMPQDEALAMIDSLRMAGVRPMRALLVSDDGRGGYRLADSRN